jgi:glucose/arabinose dehydrogenase
MKRNLLAASAAAAMLASGATELRGDIAGLTEVVGSLNRPVFVTHAPGDRERLFIVEEGGVIKIWNLNTNSLHATPFLMIPNVDTETEGGLLGLAFHPQYSTPGADGEGKFYVYATIDTTDEMTAPEPFVSHIREYSVSSNPNVANGTPREMLSFLQPQANHNGGWIGFSPTDNPDYLYINFGDGGGDDDNDAGHSTLPDAPGNAQDITNNLLGKTLRIDINGDDFPTDAIRNYAIPPTNPFAGVDGMGDPILGDDEIWAYGLRNPFRASFDRLTGDFWIGDVGQARREEIDFQPASWEGGANYGWRLREGDIATPTPLDNPVGGDEPADHVDPHYMYTRGTGEFQGFTVIGGYVYRGPDPELQGQYFFADAGSRHIWRFVNPANPLGTRDNINAELGALHGQVNQPVSFGEDAKGNLYIVDYGPNPGTGQIFRIVTDALMAGDYDADGDVDRQDYNEWKAHYGTTYALADGNKDGSVNAADYVVWRNNFGASVHELGSGSGSTMPAPEPGTGGLFLFAIAAGALLYRCPERRI